MNLQLAGHLLPAAKIYQSILEVEPRHAVANHCLGMIQLQLQRPLDGIPFLLLAVNEQPEMPSYWLGYLEALVQAGRLDAAMEALDLGRQHGLSGKSVEELASRLAGRVRGDASLLALMAQHRFAEALIEARAMTQRHPGHGLGWKVYGALLWSDGNTVEALNAMLRSTQLLPRDAEAHSNLGISLATLKRFDEAEAWLRAALAIDPGFVPAHYRLGMYYELQARYEEAEASLRTATSLRSGPLATDDEQGYSNLMYVMSHNQDIDAASLFVEHRRVGDCFEADLGESGPLQANRRDPERRLQIGFVSGDLRDHSVATFLEPVLSRLAHDPGSELHAYYNYGAEDSATARLRGHFHHWHPVAGLSDADLANRITRDGIDILVDLSGHTAENRLRTFARRPAPIQASWLGYPGTTGLRAMDYYIADDLWLPRDRFEQLFTEKLVYLPDRWAFVPYAHTPEVNGLPAIETGHLTFGSFHRLGKINSHTIRMWSQLLLALPDARLLVAGIVLADQQNTLTEKFGAHGVAGERLIFHRRCSMVDYLALHHQVDIGLDTQPFAGATTTMHSLSMGVPTLTIAGETSAAHACAGILRHVGLEGFITDSADGFVERARYWANHLSELAQLRVNLRTRLAASPSGQPDLIAAHFAAAMRQMWRRWCAGLPAESFASSLQPDVRTAT
jgi:predicted O-linked N-acetylglucosamine transferase (SPINDLY family)